MKKRRTVTLIVLLCMLVAALCGAVACGETETPHDHSFGAWTLTKDPTLTETGTAERSCTANDGEKEVKNDVPALSDATVWTKDATASTPATHTATGTDVYKSEYGTVEVTTDKTTEHTWGAWTLTKDPTLTEKGTAERSCTANDNGKETKTDVPALSDATVWTKDATASTPATHTATGTDVYKSEYGTVEVTTDKTTEHTWGAWTLTKDPTLTEKGTAERSCTANDNGKETKTDVPALSDATVWTKDATASTPATHTATGTDVYKSEYGTVEVTTDKVGNHTWGEWSWKDDKAPTEEEGATAVHSCTISGCTEKEEKAVPKLSDQAPWSLETTPATYNEKGSKVYTSEYGTVTVDIDKLVAPYDGKTYHSFNVDLNDTFNGTIKIGMSWTDASLTLDANGVGLGTAYPFSNNTKIVFKMINAETGEIEVTFTGKAAGDADDAFTGAKKTAKGYVDMDTGFIFMADEGSDFTDCNLLIPSGQYTSGAVGSVWGESAVSYAYALSYTYEAEGQKTITLYVANNVVTFGVSFKDMAGEDIVADKCYNAPQLYVKKGDTVLSSVGFDGEKMVALDGFEGEYNNDTFGTVTISGTGKIKAVKDDTNVDGAYIVAGDTLDAIMEESGGKKAYTVTVDKAAKSVTFAEAKVTVTFDMKEHGTAEDKKEGYKNVEMVLPAEPKDAEGKFLFRGWFTDDACTTPVPVPFKPTESMTLYAKWVKAITITVHAEPEEATTETLIVGAGDNMLETLNKKFDLSVKDGMVFRGWYIKDGETKTMLADYPDSTFSDVNDKMDFYSEWVDAPYVGEYKGSEVYNAGYGSSASNITISEDGKISGSKTGTIVDYDEATQIITWMDSSGNTNYFFYDDASGVLAYNYNNSKLQYLWSDMYVLSKFASTNTISVKFGVNASSKHDTSRSWYAQFVKIATKDGEKNIFIYDTFIYSDVTITNAFGVPLEINEIKSSKSVVVKTSNGEILLKVASKGASIADDSSTVDLDEHFGTYTKEEADDLELDGAGNLMLGSKLGTYKATDADDKIDAYIVEDDVTVYYEVTISGTTYDLEKVMVSLNFNYGLVVDPTGKSTDTSFNKNIEVKLPNLVDPDGVYLFRGWFMNAFCEKECDYEQPEGEDKYWTFVPSENGLTVYAKWIKKVTITVHLEDGATLPEGSLGANGTIDTFGQGEDVTIVRPSKEGKKFEGWYTDSGLENLWGEKLEDGSTTVTLGSDTTAIDLYPKWGDPPAYSGTYVEYYFNGSNSNGAQMNGTLKNGSYKIDSEGQAAIVNGLDWPLDTFAMKVTFASEDDAGDDVRALKFAYSTSSSNDAYMMLSKKIIVLGLTGKFGTLAVLVPADMDQVSLKGSYWEGGKGRVITLTISDEVVNILVYQDKVYFGVTFEDMSGEAVAADEAYHSENVIVKQNDKVLGSWGFNGTKMVEVDGYEGGYTKATDSTVDLGAFTLNGAGIVRGSEGKMGTYLLVSNQAYTATMTYDGAFYYVTLNKGEKTYTATKPMATIIFDFGDIDRGEFPADMQANLNIETVIEEPTVDGYAFIGWYEEKSGSNFSKMLQRNDERQWIFTPTTESVTLYAYFKEAVTVHVHYNREDVPSLEDYDFVVGKGEAVTSASAWKGDPASIVEMKQFLGWYKTEDCSDDKFDTYFVINEETDLYAKWSDTLDDVNYYPDETNENTKWVQEEGVWKSNNYHKGSTTAKLEILFAVEGTYSFHWFVESESERYDYLKIVQKHADGSAETTLLAATGGYNPGKEGNLTCEVMPGDVIILTYTKDSGDNGNGDDLARISNIVWRKTVYDDFKGLYKGNKGETPEDLDIDGKGGVSWAGRQGTYVTKEGNVIAVTLEKDGDDPAEYWEITLVTGDDKTYTATMPLTTVKFVIEDGQLTHEEMSVNTNIGIALPDVVNDATHKYVEGWYTSAEYTDSALGEDGLFIPEGTEVTVYGKVETMAKLTLNYNGHGPEENKDLWYKKGATPDLTEEAPEDTASEPKQYFTGWFTEAACETAYVPAPLEADKEIFAGWSTTPYLIEITNNSGSEKWILRDDGSYHIDASKTAKAYIKITFKVSGTFTFDWSCQYSNSYDTNDCLCVTLNLDPNSAYAYQRKFSASTGSGTEQAISVQAGDTLYIASMIYSSATKDDFATVSNFNFVAG